MRCMGHADPSAGIVTQETMQKQNQSHAPSNPASPGDSAVSGRQQATGRRYVELIRVSGVARSNARPLNRSADLSLDWRERALASASPGSKRWPYRLRFP